MESMRLFLFLHVCLSLLTVLCWGQRLDADVQVPAAPDQPKLLRLTNDDLAEVLQGFLDEAEGGGAGVSREKKASFIPRCDVGERCAMKHGPRIGRLCDCLRGTACNTFFLRCY
ncbi:cocaine- and amphetamine-regulated transcript 4 [Hippocampus comes]|uniref:Cocaine- and amphetamine-regulated transcript protein-like n=1 Tax=Hippocampus comes TaxID=109280 RepID=A0A3Q2YDJ9_HIPCM|nr:PREDICTED: cocaine- and amphetamine-regulated transcript protein-like [Hippocampus comes]